MKVNKLLQFLTIVACIFIMTSCHTDVSQIDTKTKPTEFSTALVTIHSEAVPEATIPHGILQSTSFPIQTPVSTEASLTILASPIAQAIESNVPATIMPEVMGRLFFYRYHDYGWFEILDSTQQSVFVNDEYGKISSPELYDGPGQSTYLTFSRYSDQIAYWVKDSPGELWISDVAYLNPQKVFIDTEGSYVPEFENPQGEIKIVWSSDDLHLFLYDLHQPELSRIFHLETNKSEVWHWKCESIFLSSKSGRLATLCPRIASAAAEEKAYAILEWGGEIWFSDQFPGEPFLSPLSDGTALWQWSSDGELLAYYDPNDVEGNVIIADKHGNTRKILPGSSLYRDSEAEGYKQYESLDVLDVDSPFIWAKDTPILLVNGFGQSDEPCPPFVTAWDPDLYYAIWPCWQAVDVKSGSVIWTETSLAKNLSLAENESDPVNMAINGLVVEPGGKAIVVQSFYPEPRLVLINLQTSEATVISRFDTFNHLYWAEPMN